MLPRALFRNWNRLACAASALIEPIIGTSILVLIQEGIRSSFFVAGAFHRAKGGFAAAIDRYDLRRMMSAMTIGAGTHLCSLSWLRLAGKRDAIASFNYGSGHGRQGTITSGRLLTAGRRLITTGGRWAVRRRRGYCCRQLFHSHDFGRIARIPHFIAVGAISVLDRLKISAIRPVVSRLTILYAFRQCLDVTISVFETDLASAPDALRLELRVGNRSGLRSVHLIQGHVYPGVGFLEHASVPLRIGAAFDEVIYLLGPIRARAYRRRFSRHRRCLAWAAERLLAQIGRKAAVGWP
jgi:hypothetical protein